MVGKGECVDADDRRDFAPIAETVVNVRNQFSSSSTPKPKHQTTRTLNKMARNLKQRMEGEARRAGESNARPKRSEKAARQIEPMKTTPQLIEVTPFDGQLSRTASRAGLTTKRINEQDLLQPHALRDLKKKLMSGNVHWIHMTISGKTFFGKRGGRNKENPSGSGWLSTGPIHEDNAMTS